MGVYGENYQRLSRLFDLPALQPGKYISRKAGSPDLWVDVLEVHPFTLELRISYPMRDPVTGEPDPSAYLRIYRDAKQAEVTHCYVGRQWQDVLGLHPPAKVLFGYKLRMNSFLNKWLDYLASQGHGPSTLQLASDVLSDEVTTTCA